MEERMVDVIIPVYRPEKDKLMGLIKKLNAQTVRPSHVFFMQTLVGEPEDTKVKEMLLRTENAIVTPVEKKDFDHGGTRNKGAAMSEAEFMLFMTQDAVPADDRLIEHLLHAMERETVATAYGRQLPDHTVGVIEHYTRQFNYPAESMEKSKEDLKRLGIKTYFCSNVCAMYRKTVYEEMGGFVLHTIFNEDMIMAAGVIQAGYEIAYVAEAAVVHAHKYTYRQQFTRNFDLAVSQRQYREIFDGVKSESEGMRLVKDTMKYLFSHGKWYLVPDLILQSGFKFLGYRFGKKYDKLPKRLVRCFSMNKAYWRD
ncbi:MAG: glycosyltransferase [Lachnospiraceae bacterium]|nr:glycosyltransferase [Lachnospiraceae bacterium]